MRYNLSILNGSNYQILCSHAVQCPFIQLQQYFFYVTEIEIYEYPYDATLTELVDHFVDVFQSQCRSTEEEVEEEHNKSGTFVLEFTLAGEMTLKYVDVSVIFK